ncbi:MAG: porin [Acidobacteria bacterium]|nr:porin [Acidobacteriota bacterium]
MLHQFPLRPAPGITPCTQPAKPSLISVPLLALLSLALLSVPQLHAQTNTPSSPGAATAPSLESAQSGTAIVQPTEPAPAPPPMPGMAGPLALAPTKTIDAGPFGPLDISGVLTGFGSWQGYPIPSDRPARADISNGLLFLQKSTGRVQFFLQVGAYNFPSLGTPLLSTAATVSDYFGPLPVAYLKLAPNQSLSFVIGKLPSLLGTEYTFSFENMNIERGLLWNQENDVNRGIQINYSKGKFASSVVWSDGFYSNRYNWITGALTYSPTPADSIQVIAAGNLGHTGYSSIATPLYQNNSDIYNLIYTHTAKRWTIQPYLQFTHVPLDLKIGIPHAASTQSGAVLGTYTLAHGFSLAGRAEFIASTGSAARQSVNLLYGPGSRALSLTLTPTYQNKAFFARAEISLTQAIHTSPGQAFGPHANDTTQPRALFETGFIF